ncbi:hypothetical protein C8Q76DRAFT_803607 [Earliella scabrosa]|nr:hypothetical protein C8Q76DRAFT_803607 [Earliella scabrosa]
MHSQLQAAINPESYAGKPLPVVQTTIKNGLRHCNAADMSDFMSILKTFAHGPFLTSINSFHPHSSQRPLDNAVVATLCGFLLVDSWCQVDSVKGLVNAAYTIIPTQQWKSLASPPLPTFFNVSALPTLQDLPSGYPISFSHGHRKAALQAMLDQPETRDAVIDMYGEELMWPVYVMPQYLLDFIPEEYWTMYIFYLNRVDPAQKPADSTELFATWLFHIDHLYNQLYCSEEHRYSISTVADKKITDIYGQSKIHYLTSPKMHGELSLNHPRVLSTLAAALHIPPARLNFHQAMFKVIKKSNYWLIVTFLELGAAQLQPYATVPYQHWNDFVSDNSTESQPPTASKKSATTVSLRSLNVRFNAQQWIRHLYIPGDRQGNSDRMEKFIDSLEKGDMDLLWAWPDPSRLAWKPGFYNFACLPQKSFIWTAICGGGSKADGTSGTRATSKTWFMLSICLSGR